MKKLLKKFIVALVLCTVLAASVGFVSADAAVKMTKTEKKAMNKAYKKKLKKLFSSYKKDEYIDSFTLWYSYFDMDGDGIDEMLVDKAFDSGFDNVAHVMKFYKYVNGKIIDMTKKISIYATGYDFANNYDSLITNFEGDAYEVNLYKRSGNYYKKIGYHFDGEETVFEIYDKKSKGLKETTASEFWDYVGENCSDSVENYPDWQLYGEWTGKN